MDENMECPICKKKVVFVGVHDDEGNYHGPVGCEYENDPWSGLSYALHHEGWGDCPLCTDGAYSTMGGMLFDTAEEAINALTQPNEPMTIEQLREMEDPVWCVCKTVEGFEGFWCLCNHGYILTPARQIFDVKEIPHWVFYRRPPEGEA